MQTGAQQEVVADAQRRDGLRAACPEAQAVEYTTKPHDAIPQSTARAPARRHGVRRGTCRLQPGLPRSDACSGARSRHDRRASLPRARVAGRAARVLRDAGRRGPEPRVNGSGDRRCAGTKLATIDTYGGRCGPAGARHSCRRARPKRMGRQHHIAERARAEPIFDHARQRPSLAATARGALHTACRPTGADLPEQVWPTTPGRRGERLHPSRARPLIPAAVYPRHRA